MQGHTLNFPNHNIQTHSSFPWRPSEKLFSHNSLYRIAARQRNELLNKYNYIVCVSLCVCVYVCLSVSLCVCVCVYVCLSEDDCIHKKPRSRDDGHHICLFYLLPAVFIIIMSSPVSLPPLSCPGRPMRIKTRVQTLLALRRHLRSTTPAHGHPVATECTLIKSPCSNRMHSD